ncbi:MAG: hypothetical protein ACK5LC_03235, partial [Coprobacillaceae bacterium]
KSDVETEEKVSVSTLEKIKEFFAPKKDEKKELTEEEINELVNSRASELVDEKLQEIVPKAKKEKETELNAKMEEIDKEKKELEIKKSLDNVRDDFTEFVKFQAEKEGISIEEYLKDNKQYVKDAKNTKTVIEQNKSNGVKLSEKDAQLYSLYKDAGVFDEKET